MVGLDTSIFSKDYEMKNPPYTKPGINPFNAFPMFFIKYVRDGNLFSVEEAVSKTSTMAARVHNLEGRGVLKEGAYADVVLMNIPKLKVLATEIEPRMHPEGIEYVMVNGVLAVENGKHTGSSSGRVLKRI
jgi:N-acyl-D-amino-acid deacylase